MPHVMLRRDRQGNFKRTVTPLGGGPSRRLEFAPGEVRQISDDEVPSLLKDLGHALVPVEWSDAKKKFVVVELAPEAVTAAADQSIAAGDAAPEPGEPEPGEPDADAVESEPVASPEKTDGPKTGRQDRKRR